MANSFIFSVVSLPSLKLAYTNRVYVSRNDFNKFETPYKMQGDDPYVNVCIIPFGSKIYMMSPNDDIAQGTIGLNQLQRSNCNILLNKNVVVKLFDTDVKLLNLHMEVDHLIKNKDSLLLELDELTEEFHKVYNDQIFHEKNKIAMDFNGIKLCVTILFMETTLYNPSCFGKISQTTNLTWEIPKNEFSGPKGTTQEELGATGPTGHTGPTEN